MKIRAHVDYGRRWVAANTRRTAAHATRKIVQRYAQPLDMWVGCGYPKSGTMWLCRLLSSYLGAPLVQNSLLPVAMRSVIHAHWSPYEPRHKIVYIVRDGRDVMVSMYFHQLQILKRGTNPRSIEVVRRRFQRLVGDRGDINDIRAHLPAFIRAEAEDPHAARLNWGEHVNAWVNAADSTVAILQYEYLLADPVSCLHRALRSLKEVPDDELIEMAVARHDFTRSQRLTTADTSYKRRGAAGDWRNYFTKDAAQTFDSFWGDILLSHGYESDRSWTTDVGPASIG